MNETNRTLKSAEQLTRKRFPEYFGDSHCIDRIVSNTFRRKVREINYITVCLAPDGPPLDHRAANEFDIRLKKELMGHDIRDWPAIVLAS